ncbi:hypothetical protein M885DRAFT_506097 [Pelagophyceae sp. CCMP2097]|nr:hypothetical protein M885DRAFT_506097 [Pelagophyceae sp. CCMP2097]
MFGGGRAAWIGASAPACVCTLAAAALALRAAPTTKALTTLLFVVAGSSAAAGSSSFAAAPERAQAGRALAAARHRAVVILSGHSTPDKHVAQFRLVGKFVVDALDADADTAVIGVVLCLTMHGAEAFRNASKEGATSLSEREGRVALFVDDASSEQFLRLDGCFRNAEAARLRRGWGAATHYVRTRPDMIITKRIPPLAQLRPHRVALRARWIVYPSPTATDRAKLSAFWQRCSAGSAALRSQSRDALSAAGLGFCAIVDDQFAVVPAALGPSYFRLEPDWPRHPEPGKLVWSDSPSFHDSTADYDSAVKETYGAWNHSDVYRAACKPLVKQATRNYGGRGFQGEHRLTWRLMMRLVPVAVEPFHACITGFGDQISHLEDAPDTC